MGVGSGGVEIKNKDGKVFLTVLDPHKALNATRMQYEHYKGVDRWYERWGKVFEERIKELEKLCQSP